MGLEGRYEVSDFGRVRSRLHGDKPRILISNAAPNGYLKLTLGRGRGRKRIKRSVHRLVLESFVCKRPSGFECSHENGDRADNRLANLRWRTPRQNYSLRYVHGTEQWGVKNAHAKLNDEKVMKIRTMIADGVSAIIIGKRFGVHKSAIHHIKGGRTWRHLSGAGANLADLAKKIGDGK